MTKKTKTDTTEIEITYEQALGGLEVINPTRNGSQGVVRVQSDLSKAKGDVALQVYFLKHEIQQTFRPYDDMFNTIREQARKLLEEKQKLTGEKKTTASDRLKKITNELDKLDEDMRGKSKKTEKVKLVKGKLKISEVKQFLSSDDIERLRFAIDMNN